MSRRLREITPPFVVARPSGARVRTRLKLDDADEAVLMTLGTHLGSLAGRDVAERCSEGRLSAEEKASSRRERKRALTVASSSRWAGAITRTSEDAWQLALRNLMAERQSLTRRTRAIRHRLALPIGVGRGKARGYATRAEHYEKRRRLQVLCHRLAQVQVRLEEGRLSVCRGGKSLARAHHHLADARLSEAEWQKRWRAERLFLTADGEKDQLWGNLTIRFHPDEHWLEIKLPQPLTYLANRPYGRYRLSCAVAFSYRGDEVAAQAASGAVRYDISYDPDKRRWYMDASWRCPRAEVPSLDELRGHRVLAIDVNAGHLAAIVVDPSGNPTGTPITVALTLAGLVTTTRDGHLRQAISGLLGVAESNGCQAIVIEDLDFAAQREEGREHSDYRPSRGKRGRAFRRLVAGLPTAKFRDRLSQMAANAGLRVIAVDAAYTSMWGAEHWLGTLQKISADASGHHAAALVIGRRGLGQRARRRERCASMRPEDRKERATDSTVWPVPAGQPAGLSEQRTRDTGTRKARGQPLQRHNTRPADRSAPVDQVTQDRSGSPTGRDSVPLSA